MFIPFRYYYNHQAYLEPWPKYTGSKHGDEIEMIFGIPLYNSGNYNEADIDLSENIMSY